MQDINHESTYLELGWNSPHVEVGSGYDFANRQVRSSAFDGVLSPQKASAGGGERLDLMTISSSDDKKKLMKAETTITIPIKGSTLKLENEWLTSVETSKTKLSKVLVEYYEDPAWKLDLRTAKPKLSDEALTLMKKGWQDFTQIYGEYFVYGYIARASFDALIEITTSDESTRDELKTALSLDIKGKAGIEAAFSKISETQKKSAEVKITVKTLGLSDSSQKRYRASSDETANPNESTLKGGDIDEVYTMYRDWRSSYEKQPWKALLCHYSVVYPAAPKPQDQFAFLGGQVKDMYEDLFSVQIELAGSKMRGAITTAKEATSLVQQLLKVGSSDTTTIEGLKTGIEKVKLDAKKWALREELLDNLPTYKEDFKNLGADSDGWIYGADREFFTFGLYDESSAPTYLPIYSDHQYLEDDHQQGNAAGYNYATSRVGESTRILVGFQIHNKWADSTNGWFRWKSGNVGDSSIEIEWCTQSGRGMHWALYGAFVNKDVYRKL